MGTPQIGTPQFNIRGFWRRPEGKTGALVLLATVVAGIYGFSLALPWLIAFATNALYFGVEVAALLALVYVLLNKTFRNRMKNIFQMGMRWMTSIIITIDPIAILENSVDQMVDNKSKLDMAVQNVSGARQGVKTQMSQNETAVRHATSLKEQADKELVRTADTLTHQRLNLDRQRQLQEIGRRIHSNEKLQVILDQTTKMYSQMTRWQQLADFNIENTRAEVANAKAERKTILAAFKGMGFAQRLIKGDPQQLQMLNQSLEYLVADNAQKLGEMEDFARYSEKYLTSMDLEQGAAAGDAEKMLAQYEQRLLTAGGTQAETVPAVMGDKREPVPVQRNSYLD